MEQRAKKVIEHALRAELNSCFPSEQKRYHCYKKTMAKNTCARNTRSLIPPCLEPELFNHHNKFIRTLMRNQKLHASQIKVFAKVFIHLASYFISAFVFVHFGNHFEFAVRRKFMRSPKYTCRQHTLLRKRKRPCCLTDIQRKMCEQIVIGNKRTILLKHPFVKTHVLARILTANHPLHRTFYIAQC